MPCCRYPESLKPSLLLIALAWALPATAQEDPGRTETLRTGAVFERTLGTDETHAYTVILEAGGLLDVTVDQRGVDVVVRVLSPTGELLSEIDSPTGATGSEQVLVEPQAPGEYRVELVPFEDSPPGEYALTVRRVLSTEAHADWIATVLDRQRAVVRWLRAEAFPLRTAAPEGNFDDLEPLRGVLSGVQVVGIGEATHGTREFFQFKHRLLEFLVTEMGFRVFAIESSYSQCRDINDFVLGRTDDALSALASQRFWTVNHEEMLAQIQWMRAYNDSAPGDRKVRFVGVDIQYNERGKREILSYLRRTAPERAEALEASFAIDVMALRQAVRPLRPADSSDERDRASAELRDLRRDYLELVGFLVLNEEWLTRRSSADEFRQTLLSTRVLAQYLDVYADLRLGVGLRDRYLAENTLRLLSDQPDTKVVIWAHNEHIAKGPMSMMGEHLRDALGDAYYALGFGFNQGAFQARELLPQESTRRTLRAFVVGPAPKDSVGWYLAQTGIDRFLIDFRSPVDKTGTVNEWLETARPMRSPGSVYSPELEEQFYVPSAVGLKYDGLAFFETTSRARPNPTVEDVEFPETR